jgi:hypothetical protein
MNKKIILVVALALVIGVVLGYALTHRNSSVALVASPVGSYFSNVSELAQTLVTSTSTIFARQNTGSGDAVIKEIDFFAQNSAATSSNYIIQCATSSTPYSPVGNIGSHLIFNQALNALGTTTGQGFYFSTSSPGESGSPFGTASTTARVVPQNAWLVCSTTDSVANTNSANTLDVNTTGFIAAPYQSQ